MPICSSLPTFIGRPMPPLGEALAWAALSGARLPIIRPPDCGPRSTFPPCRPAKPLHTQHGESRKLSSSKKEKPKPKPTNAEWRKRGWRRTE